MTTLKWDKLLYKVCEYPVLWDKTEPQHYDPRIIELCWEAISKDLHYEKNELRVLWEYMRGRFSVEIFHVAEDDPRNPSTVIISSMGTDGPSLAEPGPTSARAGPSPPKTANAIFRPWEDSGRLPGQASFERAMTDAELRGMTSAQQSEEKPSRDPDVLFFESILPHVKMIPVAEIDLFRLRIGQITEQFAYPEATL